MHPDETEALFLSEREVGSKTVSTLEEEHTNNLVGKLEGLTASRGQED